MRKKTKCVLQQMNGRCTLRFGTTDFRLTVYENATICGLIVAKLIYIDVFVGIL